KHFDGDLAVEPGIPGAIDLAHATRTDLFNNLVATYPLAHKRLFISNHLRRQIHRRSVEEAFCMVVGSEKRSARTPQFCIPCASFIQERSPGLTIALLRLVIDLFDPFPPL